MSDVLITVMGEKGSPGSTTTALALARAMTGSRLLIEADASGGDLPFRLRRDGRPLPESPTVLTAVAAARSSAGGASLSAYSHDLGEGLSVVPGQMAAEQAANLDWNSLARLAKRTPQTVLVDLGRIHAASPTLPLAAESHLLVPVLRPSVAATVRMLDRLERLVPQLAMVRDAPPALLPVLVVAPRHASRVVTEMTQLFSASPIAPAVVGMEWLADDPAAVAALYDGSLPRRGGFGRSTRSVAATVELLCGLPADARTAGSRVEVRGAS